MQRSDVKILIGGEAGQGLATVGELLCKCLVRSGYDINVYQSYMSRIRGGHNFFAIRAGSDMPLAPSDDIDILVALNEETYELHSARVARGGLALFDKRINPGGDECYFCVSAPFQDLAPEPIFINVAALGILAAIVGLSREVAENTVTGFFGKKKADVVKRNIEVLNNSFAWARSQGFSFSPLPEAASPKKRLMLDGNQAIALGAMAAGVNFCSFYPMTPSTSVALTLIAHAPGMDIIVEQAEDEIAAVNMALGASYAGARVLVPTSGGGFALMTEGVSLAGMTETPIVFVIAQRPGPATGLPTRTGQGDLNLVLAAGHGEFPRAVFAPGDHDECFLLTHKAAGLAEKYQTPVFVLTDQYLADNYRAVTPPDLDGLPQTPGPLLNVPNPENYKRYAVTESGVSPRAVPGLSRALVVVDSDEHDEHGHITEDLKTRVIMEDKRNRKAAGLFSEIVPPVYLGDDSPEVLLICWGSTRGAALEAAKMLRKDKKSAAVMHFSQVWPINPEQFMPRFESARLVVCVEGNTHGQLAGLIRRETGYLFNRKVLRYDGLPFTAAYILENLG